MPRATNRRKGALDRRQAKLRPLRKADIGRTIPEKRWKQILERVKKKRPWKVEGTIFFFKGQSPGTVGYVVYSNGRFTIHSTRRLPPKQ